MITKRNRNRLIMYGSLLGLGMAYVGIDIYLSREQPRGWAEECTRTEIYEDRIVVSKRLDSDMEIPNHKIRTLRLEDLEEGI